MTNPMLSGRGPAAYADRANRPDMTLHGTPKIVPMRVATDFFVEPRDPDPRGMTVIGADGAGAGTVVDIWVDRSEPQVRYLEVEVASSGTHVLLPITIVKFNQSRGHVRVNSILARQFADVPRTARPDIVTLLEEDKIQAYYSAGNLYAEPSRLGPWL